MYVINKVNVVSFARINGLLVTVTLLLPWLGFGIFYGVVTFFITGRFDNYYGGSIFSNYLFPQLIVWLVTPLIIYLIGFLAGLLFGWLFNLIAEHTGGLKVNIVLEKDNNA
jgi:hypothetical protein